LFYSLLSILYGIILFLSFIIPHNLYLILFLI
jgi:hypothetical protein